MWNSNHFYNINGGHGGCRIMFGRICYVIFNLVVNKVYNVLFCFVVYLFCEQILAFFFGDVVVHIFANIGLVAHDN